MKKVISSILLALFLNLFVIVPVMEAARPAYCGKAFTGCREDCGGGWFGEFCSLGCGIGYLMCG